ncbi:MAG TPA: hypothetical protein VKB42_19425 [Dongiaceae bacterium]|nr:hypothetical protein [Dongiaceae bacterium]
MQHSEGGYRPILCEPEGCRVLGDAPASDALAGTRLEMVPLERGLIAVKSGDLYLCAEPGGRLSLSRTLCSLWECFLASEDWCTADHAAAEGPGREAIAADHRAIADYIVDPAFRMKTRKTEAKKFLVFGYTQWSHGRAYYDLAKLLHDRGYVLISWTGACPIPWRPSPTCFPTTISSSPPSTESRSWSMPITCPMRESSRFPTRRWTSTS